MASKEVIEPDSNDVESSEKPQDEEVLEEVKSEEAEVEENEEKEEKEEVSRTPAPNRRGGNRRSRKRRGGRRPAPSVVATASVQPQKVEESIEETPTETVKEENDGEIEVTQQQKEDEEAEAQDESGSEQRDPSPVVTRRSNRKIQQQQKEEETVDMVVDEVKNEEEANCVVEMMDQDEVESVASELDSIDSGSTLTTRSRRRGGTQEGSNKGKKCSKMGKRGQNGGNNGNATNAKGKSRRIIFKKSATRAPTSVAKAVTSERVYYRGQYYAKGDIVSLEDEDGSVYYAQLRGFLTDQYCEKSGVITWLLPTVHSPPPEDKFDPSTYVIGPEEDLPRKLEYLTFVMHAPDDYFYYRKAPYPTETVQTDQEFLVTRFGPRLRVIKAGRPVYQETVPPLIPLNAA